MGVILYCLVVGSQPWDGASSDELIEQIFTEGLVIPEWVSEECADLIIKMLRVKEKDRITLCDMKLHPWVMQDYNTPPPCYLPDQNPVSEIDDEIMQQLVQIGFQDTPDARAQILANEKTQLVVTYHLLLQNLPADKKKKRGSDYAAKRKSRRSIEMTKDGSNHQRKKSFSFMGGGVSIPEDGEAAAAAAAIAAVQQSDVTRNSPSPRARRHADEARHASGANGGESAAAVILPSASDSPRSGSPRSGSFTITSADVAHGNVRKNASPLRGAMPPSPTAKVVSQSVRRSSSPVPMLDVAVSAVPPQSPDSKSPTSSPGRSKSPKKKKKHLMPKLKLDAIGGLKNDPKMPMSADHRKLPSMVALSALADESKLGPTSERKMSNGDDNSPPRSDTDSDSDWRVGSLPEGSLDKWMDRSNPKPVHPPKPAAKRPVLTIEELKKEVDRTSAKSVRRQRTLFFVNLRLTPLGFLIFSV
jgi:serine/threonine protein kinase